MADGREVGETQMCQGGTKQRSHMAFAKSQINACVLFLFIYFTSSKCLISCAFHALAVKG